MIAPTSCSHLLTTLAGMPELTQLSNQGDRVISFKLQTLTGLPGKVSCSQRHSLMPPHVRPAAVHCSRVSIFGVPDSGPFSKGRLGPNNPYLPSHFSTGRIPYRIHLQGLESRSPRRRTIRIQGYRLRNSRNMVQSVCYRKG